jgi:hypothetical protein
MKWPIIKIGPPTDHFSEILLLAGIAGGVMWLMGMAHQGATPENPFDPSAYLVVLTLIIGAIKERWTQRSVDRMGQQLGQSQPQSDGPIDARIVNTSRDPAQVEEVK